MKDNNKVHIVSEIIIGAIIRNKVFTNLDDARSYFEYSSNLPQDRYSNVDTYVFLEEDVTIE